MTWCPRGCDAREVPCLAHEDLKAELFLQQLDLLAHALLRGVELLSGGRDVEVVLDDRRQIAQLMQFHLAVCRRPDRRRVWAARRTATSSGERGDAAGMRPPLERLDARGETPVFFIRRAVGRETPLLQHFQA